MKKKRKKKQRTNKNLKHVNVSGQKKGSTNSIRQHKKRKITRKTKNTRNAILLHGIKRMSVQKFERITCI